MGSRPLATLAVATLVLAAAALSLLYGGRWSGRVSFAPGALANHSGDTLVLGSRYFYASAGGGVEIDYDVTVDQGEFLLYVFPLRLTDPRPEPHSLALSSSASGRFTARVPAPGFYYLAVSGRSAAGPPRGYDARFRLRWRVR